MTWNELAAAIAAMTTAERRRTVYFYESYDDEPQIIEPALQRAEEELTQDVELLPCGDEPGQVQILAGEWYLA